MAAKPTLLLSPHGSFESAGLIAPVITGGVRVIPGTNGDAWQIAQATTNLIRNPRFDPAPPAGNVWVVSNVTRADDGSLSPGGHPTARYVVATSGVLPYIYHVTGVASVVAGLSYSGRIWVKCGAGGRTAKLQVTWRTNTGAQISAIQGPSYTTVAGEWLEVRFENIVAPANADSILFLPRFGETGAMSGDAWHVGEPQFEQISYCTPYVDGTLGTGFAWAGEVNGSNSTRAATYVYTTIAGRADINRGSMMMRYRLDDPPRANAYLFGLGGLSGPHSKAYYTIWRTSASLWAYRDNANTQSSSYRATPNATGDYIAYFAWDETTVWFDYGDGVIQSMARTAHDGTWFTDRLNLLSYVTGGQVNSTTEGALVFDQPLTDEERLAYAEMSRWSWQNTFGQFVIPTMPVYQSGLYRLVPRFYKSDRDYTIGESISQQIITATIDGDIDRTGPKTGIKLSVASKDAAPALGWIAPFVDITPETGPASSSPMGLYQLNEPTVTYDMNGGEPAENTGKDIIGLLEQNSLTWHEAIYPGTNVMAEIRRCIEIATMQYVGANIWPYSLKIPKTDWGGVGDLTGFIGTDTTQSAPGQRPRGDHSWLVNFGAGTPAGSGRYMITDAITERTTLSPSTVQLMVNHYYRVNDAKVRTFVRVRFYDAAGAFISTSTNLAVTPELFNSWIPVSTIHPVPDNAASFGILAYVTTAAVTDGTEFGYIAGIEVHSTLGEPLRRFALPSSPATVAKMLAHRPGTKWLTRINELAAAGGHHAVSATFDGRPTSYPIRNVQTTNPARTFTVGQDIRVASSIITAKTTDAVKNIVIAVKEDIQAKTFLKSIKRNDNPRHPWSTARIGPRSVEIVVNEAVDQAGLDKIAAAYLARVSENESIQFAVLPDPTLSVHDIIEVAGTLPDINGRWSIDSLTWGITADSPLMLLKARRVTTSSQAT